MNTNPSNTSNIRIFLITHQSLPDRYLVWANNQDDAIQFVITTPTPGAIDGNNKVPFVDIQREHAIRNAHELQQGKDFSVLQQAPSNKNIDITYNTQTISLSKDIPKKIN